MILPAGEPVRFWTQKFVRRTSMANEERGGPRLSQSSVFGARTASSLIRHAGSSQKFLRQEADRLISGQDHDGKGLGV